jgi:hypothetical protein
MLAIPSRSSVKILLGGRLIRRDGDSTQIRGDEPCDGVQIGVRWKDHYFPCSLEKKANVCL